MILKTLHLKNIRSYKEETLHLPEGTTLLAGDIGSGKSTVLHAVEFALFGVLRGVLPGETLLRYGENEGSVLLELEIDSKNVIIQRTLRRTKAGIGQESGSITINSVLQPLTPTEIKSRVLELLGYPSEFLTKHRGLIYRYTVYTPQEEMKRILFEESEPRLNTLRSVFDIDKYRHITENARIYSKFVRERCTQNEGRIADIEQKRAQLKAKQEESARNVEGLEKSKAQMTLAKNACAEAKAMLGQHEGALKKLTELRQRLAVAEREQNMLIEQRFRLRQEAEAAQAVVNQIEETQESRLSADSLREMLSSAELEIRKTDSLAREAIQCLGMSQAKAEHSTDLSKRLSQIDTCPTCLQKIMPEHRQMICTGERQKLEASLKEVSGHKSVIANLESARQELQKKFSALNQQLQSAIVVQTRQERRKEAVQRLSVIEIQSQTAEKKITEIIAVKGELSKAIYPIESVEQETNALKEKYSTAQANERAAAVLHSRLCGQQEGIERQIAGLREEIDSKLAVKAVLELDRKLLHWMDEGFLKLMALMEQHVMSTVYHQFNDAFSSWFNTLIEDNLMTVRLDETFSPVVVQNGYEIAPEHLSGGEKTSLALAYRLALNKVINDLHTSVKTRDIIILDEPTDGFSSEQLDKVRDVMRQLPVRQCILVSHESKIESFVDQVINIEKQGHVSRVVC